jgi:mono/diheme cytochrome c family protein
MKNLIKGAIILLVLLDSVNSHATPPENGKIIFTARCASCHSINHKIIGPALAFADERHDIDWIVRFVQSSQTMVRNGDKDAVALFNQFNNTPMPDHPDLTNENIKDIVSYIKNETDKTKPTPAIKVNSETLSFKSIVAVYKNNIFISLTSLLTLCLL